MEVKMVDFEFEEELRNKIRHHPPKHDGIAAKHSDYREAVFKFGQIIGILVPDCDERKEALKKLEEVMFWGNAGIARHQGTETHQFTSNPIGGDNCVCGAPWDVPVHK